MVFHPSSADFTIDLARNLRHLLQAAHDASELKTALEMAGYEVQAGCCKRTLENEWNILKECIFIDHPLVNKHRP